MNTLKAFLNNFSFSHLIGPTALSATLFALFLRESPMQITPLIALLGIGLCWQWHLKGLIASLVLIAVSISYEFISMSESEIYWSTLAAFSFALSLMIITLTNLESQPRQGLVNPTPKPEVSSIDLHAARHLEIKSQLASFETELRTYLGQKTSYQPIIDSLQVALQTSQTQLQHISEEHTLNSEKLINAATELSNYKMTNASLQHELVAAIEAKQELTHQQLRDTDQLNKETNLRQAAEQKYCDLLDQRAGHVQLQAERDQLATEKLNLLNRLQSYESEQLTYKNEILSSQDLINELKTQHQLSIEENSKLVSQLQNHKQELQQLVSENEELNETKKSTLETVQSLYILNEQYSKEIDLLKKQPEQLKSFEADSEENDNTIDEPKKINRALRVAKGQIKELRAQFAEKSDHLDATRKLLFHAEETLLAQQQKQAELDINLLPEFVSLNGQLKLLEIEFSENETTYKLEIDALTDLITNLMYEKVNSKE